MELLVIFSTQVCLVRAKWGLLSNYGVPTVKTTSTLHMGSNFYYLANFSKNKIHGSNPDLYINLEHWSFLKKTDCLKQKIEYFEKPLIIYYSKFSLSVKFYIQVTFSALYTHNATTSTAEPRNNVRGRISLSVELDFFPRRNFIAGHQQHHCFPQPAIFA